MAKLRLTAFSRFYAELRRRKVFKVAAAYAIVGWLIIQIGANTFPALHLPDWSLTLVIVLTVLGLPIALVLAWTVELTPAGIRAEAPAPLASAGPPPPAQVAATTALISHRSNRLARSSSSVGAAPPSAEPMSEGRLTASQLRHDLRTPMNAILGYCDVLVEEAKELGVEHLATDLKHLHASAVKLLERINEAVPAAHSGPDTTVDALLIRARALLEAPAHEVLVEAEQLAAKMSDAEQARNDLERLIAAAKRLVAHVEGLGKPHDGEHDKAITRSVEQTLNRLRPGATNESGIGGTLLVVDDNALNRDLLTRQLVREGYTVQTVGSGREALELLRLQEFDLILLDVIMPEMDGVELLEHIERDAALSGIPVIMMSALDEIGGVARCLEKGAVDYLIKPFEPLILRARIRSTLQTRHLHANLRTVEAELERNAAVMARLAHSIAPASLVADLGRNEPPPARHYPEVTAVVVRIEGVDALAARRPGDIASLLSRAFECFEQVSARSGVDLTRIADHTFTAISGAPAWNERHAEHAAKLACELRDVFNRDLAGTLEPLTIKVGVHTGLLTAGLTGGERIVFGFWGDAVSIADAIAASAPLGEVLLSNTTSAQVGDTFMLDATAAIDVPGRGRLPTRRVKLIGTNSA